MPWGLYWGTPYFEKLPSLSLRFGFLSSAFLHCRQEPMPAFNLRIRSEIVRPHQHGSNQPVNTDPATQCQVFIQALHAFKPTLAAERPYCSGVRPLQCEGKSLRDVRPAKWASFKVPLLSLITLPSPSKKLFVAPGLAIQACISCAIKVSVLGV